MLLSFVNLPMHQFWKICFSILIITLVILESRDAQYDLCPRSNLTATVMYMPSSVVQLHMILCVVRSPETLLDIIPVLVHRPQLYYLLSMCICMWKRLAFLPSRILADYWTHIKQTPSLKWILLYHLLNQYSLLLVLQDQDLLQLQGEAWQLLHGSCGKQWIVGRPHPV